MNSHETLRLELNKETVAVLRTAEASSPHAVCTCCSMSALTLCCGSDGSPPTCCK